MNKSSMDQRERAGSQQCWSLMKTRQKLTASNCEASLIEQFPAIFSTQRHTCAFVSYVFIVVKTHVRPFAVSGILSQLAWIWAFSWRDTLRKMWFTISSTLLTNTFNNNNVLTFNFLPIIPYVGPTHMPWQGTAWFVIFQMLILY